MKRGEGESLEYKREKCFDSYYSGPEWCEFLPDIASPYNVYGLMILLIVIFLVFAIFYTCIASRVEANMKIKKFDKKMKKMQKKMQEKQEKVEETLA